MTDLATTLAKLRQRTTARFLPPDASVAADHLQDFDVPEPNPGALRARVYVPATLPVAPALVVVLHGCTQTAADYDRGSGWSQLAETEGFVVLFPEQQPPNNPNRCFNWFSPVDQRRGSGEAQSIRTMVAAMVAAHGIDERRIFVTGLSAGGATAMIMLATYPEVFAGGAIIAGLPFGCARSVPDAFARMRGEGHPAPDALAALVRDASAHQGPWPTLSVWQGGADTVVDPANAEQIIAQWQRLHGVDARSTVIDTVDGAARRRWHDRGGRPVIEAWTIAGMGHGTPLATRGSDALGRAGPYLLEAGISSTRHIANGWGLTTRAKPRVSVTPAPPTTARPLRSPDPVPKRPASVNVGSIIDDALRAAGLLR